MTLFELIDRWHKRKILLRLIEKKEKEAQQEMRGLGFVNEVAEIQGWTQEDRRSTAQTIVKSAQTLQNEAEEYKRKLNELI